ncbi:hypothetical protein JCM10908_006046 [Rhodotorula pacifica]|uniref:GNAT family N-acetyltransferase n=1 Tax=Rhodotorula pacifica TaxID=1495444 RepID=UPI00316F2785
MSAILSALPELPKLVEPAQTINGKRIRIPPRVNLSPVTVNNLGTVRKLHNVLFPVNYDSKFYSALTDDRLHRPEDYCKLIYYQDLPVGVLVCRLEETTHEAPRTLHEAVASQALSEQTNGGDEEGQKKDGEATKEKKKGKSRPQYDDRKTYKLYIMTLGVLAPYRNQGLGAKLIHHVLSVAAESLVQPAPAPPPSTPAPAAASPSSVPKANGTSSAAAAKSGKASDSAKKAKDEEDAKKKEEEAEEEKEPLKPRIESVYLHVQVGNDEGKKFWEKWGFEVKDTVKDYYRKISPRDAWLLERKVAPSS